MNQTVNERTIPFGGSRVLITGGLGDGGVVVTDPFCNRSDFDLGSIQSNTA